MNRSVQVPAAPPKLALGSHLRVIAPSRSMAMVSPSVQQAAKKRLASNGFAVSYGAHVFEEEEFNSASVAARVEDLHAAFDDPTVNGILTCIGGYSANQLLDYLDYKLIGSNPKVLCGFSDITVLANAINARTGLITYIGPHFSSWGMEQGFEYSAHGFISACRCSASFRVTPSSHWSDDAWYEDQAHRRFHENAGFWLIQPGEASDCRTVSGGTCVV